ncbi:MAG: SLBB domain-containing protein, partial [Saprospiraceae bacterium]|nr:SLBB domain-containing protein [Saprospiraceae bacterium]
RRYIQDDVTLIDVNLRELQSQGQDFTLNAGDVIDIPAIPTSAENVVSIQGAVDFPGDYAFESGLRISDLLARGRLSRAARRDIAYLLKKNVDGSMRYRLINLTEVLANGTGNVPIEPGDQLMVLSQRTYVDAGEISISGAVRDPRSYPYNAASGLQVNDLITLAGGLTQNASSIAYLYRKAPGDENHIEYIRLNVQEAVQNPGSSQNLALQPNDQLRVFSTDYFREGANVKVAGAVRNPGEYAYDPSLTLTDVLLQAGGLTLSGASNRIEISRVLIEANQPTRTVIATVQVDSAYRIISGQESSLHLEPFDQIFVRNVPQFEFQQNITIEGEVQFPGTYALIKDNERLADVIARAGGLTPEAFPKGMDFFRTFESTGHIVTRLDEALANPNSNFNIVLKAGDRITIPKTKDLVTIEGATKARELYPEQMIDGSRFHTAYQGSHSAKWYIDNYAAGVSENGERKSISVRLANGELKKTTNLGLFKIYPKVKEGSTIRVAAKPPEPLKSPDEPSGNSKVDWGKVLSDSLAQATSLLTLILLLQRIN